MFAPKMEQRIQPRQILQSTFQGNSAQAVFWFSKQPTAGISIPLVTPGQKLFVQMKQAKFVISNYTGSDFPRCIFVECGGITGETLMGADAMQPSVPTACIGILIPTQVATSVDGSSTIVYTGLQADYAFDADINHQLNFSLSTTPGTPLLQTLASNIMIQFRIYRTRKPM